MSRPIYWHKTIDSTMIEAARLAAEGCPSGTIVGADEQTAGQGRLGRHWHSSPGDGLYVSFIVRVSHLPARTLAAGLAARAAIAEITGVQCDLRWPNDLLARGRKLAGILVNSEPSALVIGIGINLNHQSFPPDLAPIATSLAIESGHPVHRDTLLPALAAQIDDWLPRDPAEVIAEFQRVSSYAWGRRVTADDSLTGITAGLDPTGFLLLRKDNGEVVRVLAGNVRPVE